MYRYLMVLLLAPIFSFAASGEHLVFSLAKNKKAEYVIVSPTKASSCEKFAAQELEKWLSEMSGADFAISNQIRQKAIVVSTVASLTEPVKNTLKPDMSQGAYTIFRQGERLYIVGKTPATTLYGVYDFLSQLGCRWVAPDFDFFGGTARTIPHKARLDFAYRGKITESPAFKYRKLYVEEGKTHNLLNLKQLIDWMPKLKYNTLVIPIDYQGHGKVRWDNWREELIPELHKRGILIEVGGHGYQNFLNASMENGRCYDLHPEWFGMDKSGVRSKDPSMVICTSNADAVDYLEKNVLAYLKVHPEIDILDFWPPDGDQWCQCEACKALGSETDRHAMLVNRMAALLQEKMPRIVVECLAYSKYIAPTTKVRLNDKVLLDFCPINQSFEYQIYEDKEAHNKAYNEDLLRWTKTFDGDISIYSYFRKYGWRSLPNIIPHYMQRELNYYNSLVIKGISVYSEPGDWFTYGLNHFVLASLAWNPEVNVDSLIETYAGQIYGKAAPVAIHTYRELEDIVRFACRIPYTSLKRTEQYDAYAKRVETCREKLGMALDENAQDPLACRNLKKLDLMLGYAGKSIQVMRSQTLDNKNETARLESEVKTYVKVHEGEGVFIP